MKVLLNQGVVGPCLNSLFFGYTIVTRQGTDNFLDKWRFKLQNDLLPTTKHSFMCWGPFHVVSFLYIPESYRMLCISVLTVAWMSYMSWRAFRTLPLESAVGVVDTAGMAPSDNRSVGKGSGADDVVK